jgi:hypothetical protein
MILKNEINRQESSVFTRDTPLYAVRLVQGQAFMKVGNSRIHKRIDDKPVLSISCFFIEKNFCRLDVSVALSNALLITQKNKK